MFTLIILVFIMAACSSESNGKGDDSKKPDSEQGIITLKLADYNPTTGFWHKNIVEPFIEMVTERTNNRVQFDTYPGGQLGGSAESLDLVRKGTVDMSVLVTSFFESNMPLSTVMGVPGVVDSHDTATKALNEILFEGNSELLEIDYLSNDIIPMLIFVLPENNLFTKGTPIRTPEDLKGLKMRSSSTAITKVYEDLGSISINLPTTEAYHSLDTGVVEGVAMPFTAIESFGLNEVVDSGSNISFGSNVGTLVMKNEVWEKLPEDIRDIIIEVREELIPIVNQAYIDETARILNEFKKENEFIELTAEEQKEWNNYWEEFLQTWVEESKASKDLPYDDLIKQIKEKSKE